MEKSGHFSSEFKKISLEEKKFQWEKKLAELKIPDHYGYVIEEGIKETVAVLQLIGFNTTQSCQGDHAETPWVEFEAEAPKDFYVGEKELKTELMEKLGILPDEIDPKSPLFSREKQVDIEGEAREELSRMGASYTAEYKKWHQLTKEMADKLQGLIGAFYETQPTPKDFKDVQVCIDFPYRFPQYAPYIQDIPYLQINPTEESPDNKTESKNDRNQRVLHNQDEMKRFTEFLKEQFFSSNS